MIQGKVTVEYFGHYLYITGEANEPLEAISRSEGQCHYGHSGASYVRFEAASYITAGTVMPITASTRANSLRTTATVASRNFFRPSSASLRMG